MNPSLTFLHSLCLLTTAAVVMAGTGVGVSSIDATVDTTNWLGTLSVTMHRATASVLENTAATAVNSDEPLRVKATNRALLGSQLISGTPTAQGATSALVSVTNANGAGSKQVDLAIAGPPGAPTDVGLGAEGVNSGKPVGTVVGRFVTVDPNPLDTFTYELMSGTGSADNGLFTIAGDTLVTAAVLDGAVTSTVSIRVRTTDSSAASFEKVLVLPVGIPPVIIRQPDARQVFAGESATMFVETTGLPPLQYQWKKDGVDVDGGNGRILEIASANPSQAGSYTVTVTNGDGTATSTAASLVVNPISYGRWAADLPSTTPQGLLEPIADYNGDGIVNFLDFAFGVPPGAVSALGARPFFTYDAVGPIYVYYAANGIEPLNYRVLKSTDLSAGAQHIPAPGEVTTIDHGSYTEVRVRVPRGDPKMFLRLEVGTQ